METTGIQIPSSIPIGPKSKTQKINYSRDISKNKYAIQNNINLIRFWEYDILNNTPEVKKQLLCILKK